MLVDLPTIAVGLAAEALYAAKTIAATPKATRGGPWLRPILYDHHKKEYKAVARCETMAELFAFAKTLPASSSLVKRLKNTKFYPVGDSAATQPKPPEGAPRDLFCVAPRRRSGGSTKSGRSTKSGTSTKGSKSGVCGHKYRSRLIKDNKMKVGDERERRLHRGPGAAL